ncbi:methyl-accepting chemotaxis protein [Vibrio marisflavi]|uniref:Methyl-accepting chemotaxis protein n=1 Tax=Vibrio marisflavi CECT 7928 TaxID=634439 RepID=A0ABN8E4A5_9VIBR|nr:methyl-accepting chemotaxis protein [Vibrio marisflavi]CAH0537723.1 hypothetical protein VMF7928_01275 [Vibrio marisflavi CECT 7928]
MEWFKDLPIKAKILGLVSVLLLLLILTSAFSSYKMSVIGSELEGIAGENIPLVQLVSDITIKQLEAAILIEKALRLNSAEEIKAIDKKFHQLSQSVDKEIVEAKQLLELAISHAFTEELKAKEQVLLNKLESIVVEHKSYEQKGFAILSQLASGNRESVDIDNLEAEQTRVNEHLKSFLVELEKVTEETVLFTESEEKLALRMMIIISSISALIGIGVGLIVSSFITSRLTSAKQLANKMAQGDFTSTQLSVSGGKDEIGELIQAMVTMSKNLSQSVSTILNNTRHIETSMSQVADLSKQNSIVVDDQFQRTDQVAAAMMEMASAITEVASSTSNASDTANQAESQIESSQSIVSKNVSAAENLVSNMSASKEVINELKGNTEAISNFVNTINEIAEQTNLLALNASIEAARAGEQGRGFAVVADEVRSLAQRSQESTGQIASLIENLKNSADSSVETIELSFNASNTGLVLAKEMGASFETLTELMINISEMSTQIATASEEQSVTAEDVNQNLTSIRDTSEGVLTSSQSTAELVEKTNQLVHELKETVANFKISKQA